MPKFINPTKVITGPDTRWSYANIWEAKSINGGAPKFSVSLIIPKSDTKTVEKIKAAIEAAYKEGESKLKGNGRSVPALSSTLILRPLPVSLTLIAAPFWSAARFTAACTAERPSHSTHSIPTVIRVSPAV